MLVTVEDDQVLLAYSRMGFTNRRINDFVFLELKYLRNQLTIANVTFKIRTKYSWMLDEVIKCSFLNLDSS